MMTTSITTGAVCGYPGQPAFGRISDPVKIILTLQLVSMKATVHY